MARRGGACQTGRGTSFSGRGAAARFAFAGLVAKKTGSIMCSGLLRHTRLVAMIEDELAAAKAAAENSGQPACRFRNCHWSALDSKEPQAPTLSPRRVNQGRGQSALCCHLAQVHRDRHASPTRTIAPAAGPPQTRAAPLGAWLSTPAPAAAYLLLPSAISQTAAMKS